MEAGKSRIRNRGFSMLELLIAVAVLSIVAITIGIIMTSSSQTYRQVSTDSQMQSEAQLVANAITNFGVDSISATNQMITGTVDATMGDFDLSDGKNLIFTNDVDGKQYFIVHETSEKKLYYFDREKDPSTGDYGAIQNKSVLADNVESFTSDITRVDKENIVAYTISYKKNGKNFTGNYQVFMRNKKYAALADPGGISENTAPRLLSLSLSPTLVYIDVKNGRPVSYSVMDGANLVTTSLPTGVGSIPFTAVLTYSGSVTDDLKKSDWTLLGADENLFHISEGKAETKNVEFPKSSSYGFRDLNKFSFYLMASKGAKSRKADIHVKIVKNLDLAAVAGISSWKNAYFSAPYNAKKAAMVPDTNYGVAGKTVTLSASLSQYNVSDGLNWKLYYCAADKSSESDWKECTDAKFARLVYSQTSGTTNTLSLGSEAKGMQFKAVCTSVYDDSFTASVNIGVAPSGPTSSDGLFSRGFYMNVEDFFLTGNGGNPVPLQSNGNLENAQDRQYVVKKIKGITFSPGVNMDNLQDLEKAFKYSPTTNTLMVDYGVFQYSKQQSVTAYQQGFELNMTLQYDDVDGVARSYSVFKFPILPTNVAPIGPSTICVAKGATDEVPVQYTYSNLISRSLIGVYTKQHGQTEFSENLNKPNYESNDKYLTIQLRENELGDVYHYVDTAKFDITGKTNLKSYPINAITVRFTLEDYYQLVDHNPAKKDFTRTCSTLTISGQTGPCTDYQVYVANVKGSDVYFAGPDAVKAENQSSSSRTVGWINTVPTSATGGANVKGIRTNGSYVDGRVYKSGSKYYLSYGGMTYTFDRTYNYWK